MSNFFKTIMFIFLLAPAISFAQEISLYNSTGEAVAYIDTDNDMSIYLWEGDPVAYLDGQSIYGFNGKHLGWLKRGIVRDNNGYTVGFMEGAINMHTKFERFKGFQKFEPFKSFQEFEPLEPMEKNQWAPIPLDIYLSIGRK